MRFWNLILVIILTSTSCDRPSTSEAEATPGPPVGGNIPEPTAQPEIQGDHAGEILADGEGAKSWNRFRITFESAETVEGQIQMLGVNWIRPDSIEFRLLNEGGMCDVGYSGTARKNYTNVNPEITDENKTYPADEYVHENDEYRLYIRIALDHTNANIGYAEKKNTMDTDCMPMTNVAMRTWTADDFMKLGTYIASHSPSADQIQEIRKAAAIIINPTEQQIEIMKEEYGEEDFYTVADDNIYYQAEALGLIEATSVPTIQAEKRYLKFVGNDKVWLLDIRRKQLPAWNIIFFKANKEPQIVEVTGLSQEDVRKYFDLK